jgi:hypothetical protein
VYSNRWSGDRLRQGDVLGKVPFPLPSQEDRLVGTQGAVTALIGAAEMRLTQASPRYVAVISHDCEFNEGKRKHFLVARVENLRKDLTNEQLEELRRGNDVDESSKDERKFPVDTFYLDPIEGVFEEPQRINFCAVAAFETSSIGELRKLKKAELDQPTRVLLRAKLGFFFGRDAEDDFPDDERIDAPEVTAAPLAE